MIFQLDLPWIWLWIIDRLSEITKNTKNDSDFRLHGGVVVSTVTSQQEGSRFNSQLGHFCVEFACSPRVCVGSLWVLHHPKTCVLGWLVTLKLSLGVSVCGCLSLCGPVMDWWPVQGVLCLFPDDCWDRLQPPHDPIDGLKGYRRWMDSAFNCGWKP